MSECMNKFFIKNDEIMECKTFEDKFVSEGKSLYEVIRVTDGVPIFLERHIERLKNSCNITNLDFWMGENDIKDKLLQLIQVNNAKDGNIKIVLNYKGDEKTFLTLFVEHHYPDKELYETGISTILYFGERNNPNAKVVNTDFRSAVDKEIKEKGVYEAVLVDRNGNITEGSRSNIFMIKNGDVLTAPLENVLPGITRQILIELCNKMNFKVVEDKISYRDIEGMDALFMSGTSPKVLPISRVDNFSFDSSRNETLISISKAYNSAIEEYIKLRNLQ